MVTSLLVRRIEGSRFGRYQIVSRIGQGGMGTVYLARLEGAMGFAKQVAVKLIHPHLLEDEKSAVMFLDEARLASQIHHPNVCEVLDFGVEEELPYLVMEYLRGSPLSRLLKETWARGDTMSPAIAARIIAETARGLHAAHELRGVTGEFLEVVHRDVSPQNIVVLTEGAIKVLDFGIARTRGKAMVTRPKELKGKLAYMAPEQLQGEHVDRRADVWALGVVLWECIMGKRLFEGEYDGQVISAVLHQSIPAPSIDGARCPQELSDIVMKALERPFENRIPSAAALADALERFLYRLGEPCGVPQIADWVRATLDDVNDLDEAVAWNIETESAAANVQIETTQTVEKPTVSIRSVPRTSTTPSNEGRKWLLRMLVGLVVAGCAAAAWFYRAEPKKTVQPLRPPLSSTISATKILKTSDIVVPHDVDQKQATTTARESAVIEESSASSSKRVLPTPKRPHSSIRKAQRVAATSTGTLHILAVPQAAVFWMGNEIGRTPILGKTMPVGRHQLVLHPLGGGESKTVTVDVREHEPARVMVRF